MASSHSTFWKYFQSWNIRSRDLLYKWKYQIRPLDMDRMEDWKDTIMFDICCLWFCKLVYCFYRILLLHFVRNSKEFLLCRSRLSLLRRSFLIPGRLVNAPYISYLHLFHSSNSCPWYVPQVSGANNIKNWVYMDGLF